MTHLHEVEIFKIPLSKRHLAIIDENDRLFLLLASQAFNQISTLQKILFFSTNHDGRDEVEDFLSAGQSQVVLRCLIGSLAETWEMIRRPENQRLIGLKYQQKIEDLGSKSYTELKVIFGSSNLFNQIRNGLAYHYPRKSELLQAFDNMPEDEDLSWYVSVTCGNTFYLGSDKFLVMQEMLLTEESDPKVAFEKIMRLLVDTANHTVDFLSTMMRLIIVEYLGGSHLDVARQDAILYDNIPHMHDVKIPFFTYR